MNNIIFIFIIIFITGCGKYNLNNRIDLANNISKKNNFKSKDIQTEVFKLRTYSKINNNTSPLKIYIEGDGFSWVDRYTLSNNPTPINPIALKLATIDKSQNILYIARPCQYIKNNKCQNKYWSDKRFSKEVVDSINQVITIFKKQSKIQNIELIGFSGGGAIVTLIASLRDDVQSIVTVAGNLDHILLHKYHNIEPMVGSLNPIKIVNKISHIPQVHYVGENDKVIPLSIAKSFKSYATNSKRIKIRIIKNTTHTKGWEKFWKSRN